MIGKCLHVTVVGTGTGTVMSEVTTTAGRVKVVSWPARVVTMVISFSLVTAATSVRYCSQVII